ncbi:terpene synthase family protein [Belliella aquatica]|uniref:Terpene synthase n=1 Tax=Belliella aquatica TaxID=1323734 RepID=A0ABQ1N3F8_9BACT|nr:terpene synthase family protein [Belliella aquatica]MCH7407428.1 terpene synthase family protein [Belliella aquatica]GGC53030.1 hypothetical protein GCM10010993_34320 [Belliella aquatica]
MEFLYPFESMINPLSDELDELTTSWAVHFGLLKTRKQVNAVKQMKINAFASCLYPNAQKQLLLPVTKFYLILFLLDDLTDNLKHADQNEIEAIYLDYINILNEEESKIKIPFSEAFNSFTSEWREVVTKEDYQEFTKSFKEYIEFQQWELESNNSKEIPPIQEYCFKRPYSSGAYLAIYFMKILIKFPLQDKEIEGCQLHYLESKATSLICLANDIGSFYKEMNEGSIHNFLIILMEEHKFSVDESMEIAKQKHNRLLFQFIQLCSLTKDKNNPILSKYIQALKYMIAGSHYWSTSETIRYHNNLNGNIIEKQ